MRADSQARHTTKLFWMLYRNLISRLTLEMSVHGLALNVITVTICRTLLHPQMVNKRYDGEIHVQVDARLVLKFLQVGPCPKCRYMSDMMEL